MYGCYMMVRTSVEAGSYELNEMALKGMAILANLLEGISLTPEISVGFHDFITELNKYVDVDWACVVITASNRNYLGAISSKLGSSLKVGDVVEV